MRDLLARTPVEAGDRYALYGVMLWIGFIAGWIAARVDYEAMMRSLTF